MMKLTAAAFRLFPLLALILALGAALAAPAPAKYEIVVLVAMDGVSVDELAGWKLPVYRELFNQGAVALLNNRTAEAPIRESNAATLSAGARAYGYELESNPRNGSGLLAYARMGANADEWVDGVLGVDLLKHNTGAGASMQAVVHPGIPALNRINDSLRYQVTPGLLGEALQKAGVQTGAFGNADRGKERDRSISLIAMNTAGWADFGDVGDGSTLTASDRPFGLRANYPFYLGALGSLPAGKYFIVIDAGDGARLEAVKPYLKPERYDALKRQAAEECGRFVQALHRQLGERAVRHRIILLNVAPSNDALERGDQLSPALMLGSDVVTGMMTSPSTRRPGLVLNTDLTASVLSFYNVKLPAGLRGNPAMVAPGISGFSRLVTTNRQMVATYMARGPVIKGYLFVLAVSLLGSLALLLAGERARRFRVLVQAEQLLRPLLIAVMLGPLVFLAAAALHIYGTFPTALFVTAVSLAAAVALHRWVRDLRLIFAVIGLTALALCIDVLAGVPLLRQSMYSYDPIAGIRFYGLGNESAGALIGTSLLGVFALLDYCKASRWWLIPAGIFFLWLVVLDAAPMWGADFGGILAGLAGYGIALLKARGAITRRVLVSASVGALVIFGALIVHNLMLPPESQSHVERTFWQAREHGTGMLVETAVRKWSMNLHLMQSSWWAFALASLLTVVIVVFFRPAGILRRALRPHPLLNAAFVGNLAAMLVALCTNDSGVVMAAVGILYLAAPLLLLIQAKRDKEFAPAKAAAEQA
ncbi:MAG: hypothetical protein ACYDCO_17500 [Armatimonadota bacterium]